MKVFINKLFFDNSNNSIIQFIRYFFVGGIAAAFNIGTLYLISEFLNFNLVIANIIAFIIGLLVNYFLSKKFVFTDDNTMNKLFEIMMYIIIGVLGLIFDTLVLWILTRKFKIYYMISKIISTLLTFIWNFGARKILYEVFK